MSDASALRMDGLMGALSRLSALPHRLPPVTDWPDLYARSNLAAAIVDRPAEDALARGVLIENDPQGRIAAEMERLRVVPTFIEALRAALLHGAAAILPLCDDSRNLREPLRLDRLRQVRGLRVFGAHQVHRESDRITDPLDPHYGEPSHYRLNPLNGGAPLTVHHSRLLRIAGEPRVADMDTLALPWMGRPVLEGCAQAVQDYREVRRLTLRVLERKQQGVLSMEGLGDILANFENGEQVISDRLALIDLMRGLLNSIAVDGKDQYTIADLGLAGLAEVDTTARIYVAAEARVPVSVLFGEAARGIASTGEGDLQVYHGRIEQIRGRSLRAPLERMAEIITAQGGMPAPGEWRVEFHPLWSPSAKEQAETAKAEADAAAQWVATIGQVGTQGLGTPEEGRRALAMLVPAMGYSATLPEMPDLPDDPPEPDDGPDAP